MWTPDQVNTLVAEVGIIVSGAITIVKLLHNNKEIALGSQDSIPSDIAHRILDNAQTANDNAHETITTALANNTPAVLASTPSDAVAS